MHLGEENKGVDASAVRFINWDRDVQEAVPPSNLNMNWRWLNPWSPKKSLFGLNLNVLHAFTSQLTAKSLCQLVTKFSRAPYKTCLSMRNLHQFVFLLLKNMFAAVQTCCCVAGLMMPCFESCRWGGKIRLIKEQTEEISRERWNEFYVHVHHVHVHHAHVHHVHVHHVTWECHIWYPWPPCF